MSTASTIFSLFIAVCGWYYLFNSQAANNLSGLEEQSLNQRRTRLRRLNGFVMLLLATGVFAGFHSVDPATQPAPFIAIWLTVFLLLLTIVVLAMLDLHLTWRLRYPRRP